MKDGIKKTTVFLPELCYYLFFGILLSAKGIGLYDGQNVFKIFLVLAVLCWGAKMAMTRWSVKEAVCVAALVLLGLVSYRASGDKSALVAVMVVTGMKNIPVKRVFLTGMVIWTCCFAVTTTLALTGVTEPLMLIHNKAGLGFVIRNSLGYTHPNVLHISYVFLMALWFQGFEWNKSQTLSAAACAFLGNLFVFYYSLSYTGFMMTMAYLMLIVYFEFRAERSKTEDIVIQCLMPVCVLTALLGPHVLKGRAFELGAV